MNIKIYPCTLTKEDQYDLCRLLIKAGYTVSRHDAKGKGIKSTAVIAFENQQGDGESEDLS